MPTRDIEDSSKDSIQAPLPDRGGGVASAKGAPDPPHSKTVKADGSDSDEPSKQETEQE